MLRQAMFDNIHVMFIDCAHILLEWIYMIVWRQLKGISSGFRAASRLCGARSSRKVFAADLGKCGSGPRSEPDLLGVEAQ